MIEKSELDEKLSKLNAGLASGKIPAIALEDLQLQKGIMEQYSEILKVRINKL